MYVGGKFNAIRDLNNVDICSADNLVRFAVRRAMAGTSSAASPRRCCCGNVTVNVRTGSREASAIKATIAEESTPPERNAPTGTSLTIWLRTEASVPAIHTRLSDAARRASDVRGKPESNG